MLNQKQRDFCNIDKWPYTGKGVRIGVFDENVNINIPFFNGRVKDPFGITTNELNSHGQKTIDIILQLAPDAEIFILPTSYPMKPSRIDALKWCIENNIQLINMSMDGIQCDEVVSAEKSAYEHGILMLCAAGNSGKDLTGSSQSEYWYSVGACNLDKYDSPLRASYSSVGPQLDVMGFSNLYIKDSKTIGRTFPVDGTSFSCPWVTGMIAKYYEYHFKAFGRFPTPQETKDFVSKNCMDLEEKGFDIKTGNGLFILPKLEVIDLNFINEIKDGAIAAYKKYGVLPSLTIAQAILESNWGKAAPDYNLFGIKWSEGCGYEKQSLLTSEYLNGQWVKVTAYFRKYNSYAESIDDHGKLFSMSRYKPVLDAENYKQACIRVQACGYATDPNYASQLINIIEQYNLNKYDEVDDMVYYKTFNDVPDWAKPTIQKLMNDGSLKGDGNGNLNLSEDATRIFVVLDRKGIL